MVIEQSEQIIKEVGKVIVGKDEVIEKVLMAIYASGHILLEDTPGVGKTTLALAFSKVLDLNYKRVQFTPDTMPSDITGFSIFNKDIKDLEYHSGAVDCNLFLGDEINRTSAKTQAALLEVMEENRVTVDGITHNLPNPFIVIATQNPVGSAGTQRLPDSQLDRFMVKLSIGYPNTEAQIRILQERMYQNPMDEVKNIVTKNDLTEIRNYISFIKMSDDILRYITELCEATRKEALVDVGVSPRGAIAMSKMARARAILRERDFVIPEDVQQIFKDVCAHRMILKPQAKIEGVEAEDLLDKILANIKPPVIGRSK